MNKMIKIKDLDMSVYGDRSVNIDRLNEIIYKRQDIVLPKREYRDLLRALMDLGYRIDYLAESLGYSSSSVSLMMSGNRRMPIELYDELTRIVDNKIKPTNDLKRMNKISKNFK